MKARLTDREHKAWSAFMLYAPACSIPSWEHVHSRGLAGDWRDTHLIVAHQAANREPASASRWAAWLDALGECHALLPHPAPAQVELALT